MSIFGVHGGCSSAATSGFNYLHLDGAGPFYADKSNYSNYTFTHNLITGLPFVPEYAGSASSIYFDGDNNNAETNIAFEYNIFGDSGSCTAGLSKDDGTCAGILFNFVGYLVNLRIRYNTFYHLNEGIHWQQVPFSTAPGAKAALCGKCDIEYNYFDQVVRIALEDQVAVIGDPTVISNNVFGNPYPSITYSSMALSAPCCVSGRVPSKLTTMIPSVYIQNNLMFNNLVPVSQTPIGIETSGASLVTNNLVQGNICAGVAYGYNFSAAVKSNTLQGHYMSSGDHCIFGPGAFFSSEAGASSPAISDNTTGTTPAAITSVAPTISPTSGPQKFPLTVTFTDQGYTSGNQPLGNTGIWYTTDGSRPVPGSGTAQYIASGGAITLAAPATVNAVGMWGTPPQPTSYPAGYGFVASGVKSVRFSK